MWTYTVIDNPTGIVVIHISDSVEATSYHPWDKAYHSYPMQACNADNFCHNVSVKIIYTDQINSVKFLQQIIRAGNHRNVLITK